LIRYVYFIQTDNTQGLKWVFSISVLAFYLPFLTAYCWK